MKIPCGLVGGYLDGRAVMIDHDALWLWISVFESGVTKVVMAQWKHSDPPSSPPKMPRPFVCYRYQTNDPKMLFAYEEDWSDEILDGEATQIQTP